MNPALEAYLAARVYESGRAIRRTTLRHNHLTKAPLGVVVWRLGGERFRAAAVAWGPIGGRFRMAVPGEPRNRPLYFAALQPFAADLCRRVRSAAEAGSALQLIVANKATVGALALLGRYLAYLSDRDGTRPDPALIEAGKHLRFYTRHTRVPGQALLVALDELLADHWATLLSPLEQANLAALDAQIAPPQGMHALEASWKAERELHVGPDPTEEIDRVTQRLMDEFNQRRAGRTDRRRLGSFLDPLEKHYRNLIEPVWELMGRVVQRERDLPEAPSVARRFDQDKWAFLRHAKWISEGGHYSTKETPRQAAQTLRRLEEAQARYEAERAVDDPACMVPYLLDGKAVRGVVKAVEETDIGGTRSRWRARIAIETPDPVPIPVGTELWWTRTASEKPWVVEKVARRRDGGARLELQSTAPPKPGRVPSVGEEVTFSTLTTARSWFKQPLPEQSPWPYRPAEDIPEPEPIDAGDAEPPPEAMDPSSVENAEAYR